MTCECDCECACAHGIWDNNNKEPWYDWQLKHAITKLITATGEDPNHPNFKDTPDRCFKAWQFWTSGYNQSAKAILKDFELTKTEDAGMVFQANIPIWSLCAHHLSPFWGVAHIGYLPDKRIVGLSKLARVADMFARRLQTQEELGAQIANSLDTHLDAHGVGVVLQCRHSCMESRGVQKAGTLTITSALRGAIKQEVLPRTEFMQFVNTATQGTRGV